MTAARESLDPVFERLGTFELLRLAGRGAVGELWEGRDAAADRRLYIQVLSDHLAGRPRACDLVREAAYSARVSHPHILPAEFVGQTGRRVYVATPFVPGVSLAERLGQPRALERDEALQIMSQCLEGLSAAHSAGIVHGNLQPNSIRLEAETGRVLVTDFCLALALSPVTKQPNLPPESFNVDYLSPEQTRGEPAGMQADLYALGVILFQLLAGRLPFQAETRASMAFQHMYEPSPGLSRFVPGLPGALSALVERLLAKDLGERYETTTQVQADLNALLRGVPLPSKQHADEVSDGSRPSAAGDQPIESLSQVRTLLNSTKAAVDQLQRERDELTARLHKVDEQEFVAERRRGDSVVSRAGAWAFICGIFVLGSYLIWNAWGESKLARDTKVELPNLPRSTAEGNRSTRNARFPPTSPARGTSLFDGNRPTAPAVVPRDESQPPYLVNTLGMSLTYLPAASFYMGSHESPEQVQVDLGADPAEIEDEYPQHMVQISRGFYLGQREVTQQQYERIMGTNPSAFAQTGEFSRRVAGVDTRQFPVENISWEDAVEFCRRLSDLPEERLAGRKYRLPTEAEWEYACRGPANNQPTRFPMGNSLASLAQYGWFPAGRTNCPCPVGEHLATHFDMHDLLGNVGEWCGDVYSPRTYSDGIWQNPVGPDDSRKGPHVVRRGPRCSERAYGGQSPDPWIGFRVACTTDPFVKMPAVERPATGGNEALVTAVNSRGMRFVRLPPGRFQREVSASCRMLGKDPPGNRDGVAKEECQRREEHIERGFFLGMHEVTRAQYRQVMTPRETAPGDQEDAESLPVEAVSWYDAQEFCRRLSALPEERDAGRRYRLPTELEWQYAAREQAGEGAARLREWVQENSDGKPHRVGSLTANSLGLHDLLGNVAEWVEDTASFRRPAGSRPAKDPWVRVIRGGSYQNPGSARFERWSAPALRPAAGLRVVLEYQPEAQPWSGPAQLTELQPATRHSGEVHAAIFSRDQRLAFSAGEDFMVRVWDFEADREATPFPRVQWTIRALAISSSGQYVATGSDDGEVNLWEFATRKLVRTFHGHQGRVYALAFDPNGDHKLLSAGEDRSIRVWDVKKDPESQLDQLAGRDPQVLSLEFMSNATRLLAGGSQGGVTNWTYPTAHELPRLAVGRLPIVSLQDLGDDRRVLLGGLLSQCVWDLYVGKSAVSQSPARNPFRLLRAGGEPLRLAAADEQGRLELFPLEIPPLSNVLGADERRTVIGSSLAVVPQAHSGPVRSLQFSLDGKRILTAGADGRVRLWSVQTQQQSRDLPGIVAPQSFRKLAVSTSGHTALTYGSDDRLWVWSPADCKQIRELTNAGPAVSAIALSADGRLAAASVANHLIRIWDTENGKVVHELRGHAGPALRIVFHSSGKQLASAGSDATVRIWEIDRPADSRVLKGHTGAVSYVDFLSGDRGIVSAGEDGTVRFWNPVEGRELQQRKIPLKGSSAIVVSPVGDRAYVAHGATSSRGAVSVWDLGTGEELGHLPVRSPMVEGLHLTFDGRFLIAAESGDHVTVWDLRHPDRKFCELAVPRAAGVGLAFTSTAGYAVMAGQDGVLRSWDLPVYRILQNREN